MFDLSDEMQRYLVPLIKTPLLQAMRTLAKLNLTMEAIVTFPVK